MMISTPFIKPEMIEYGIYLINLPKHKFQNGKYHHHRADPHSPVSLVNLTTEAALTDHHRSNRSRDLHFCITESCRKTLVRSLPDIRDTSMSSQLAGDRVCYRQRDNACGQFICDVAFYIQNALHNLNKI